MEHSERLAVLYAADAQFWDHTYVSIHSLLANNLDIGFDIWVLSEATNEEFFRNCAALENLHPDVHVAWLPVNGDMFKDAPASTTITMATYYRLLLDQLLPETIDRLLYIDGDAIVRGSIRELLALDIEDVVLAAIPEYIPIAEQPPMQPHAERLGFPAHERCFNAGVLYINLDMWRKLDIGRACIRYVLDNRSQPSKLEFRDQDALNVVMRGRWKVIGPEFNYHAWAMDAQRLNDPHAVPAIGARIPASGPVIAHYTGPLKPWQGGNHHPYSSDYWKYRMQTPYADRRQLARSKVSGARFITQRTIKRVLARLPWGEHVMRMLRARRDNQKQAGQHELA